MEHELNQALGYRIMSARKKRGFTQQELGDAVNLSGDMISLIEKGNRALKAVELLTFAHALDVPETYFISGLENNEHINTAADAVFDLAQLSEPIKRLAMIMLANLRNLPAIEKLADTQLIQIDSNELRWTDQVSGLEITAECSIRLAVIRDSLQYTETGTGGTNLDDLPRNPLSD